MYEIVMRWYNHISGWDSDIFKTRYTNLDAAKRKMIELILDDDNLFDDDAYCEISKDMMWGRVEGRREDHCEYCIEKVGELDICKDEAEEITKDELNTLIAERLEDLEDSVRIEVA